MVSMNVIYVNTLQNIAKAYMESSGKECQYYEYFFPNDIRRCYLKEILFHVYIHKHSGIADECILKHNGKMYQHFQYL